MRPQSTLNITSIRGEHRLINGNIRLTEKLIITLSNGKEPKAIQQLKGQIEEQLIEPRNYDIPVEYEEEIRIGQRRIDVEHAVEIKPAEGLSEFMTFGKPEFIELVEIRRYDGLLLPGKNF